VKSEGWKVKSKMEVMFLWVRVIRGSGFLSIGKNAPRKDTNQRRQAAADQSADEIFLTAFEHGVLVWVAPEETASQRAEFGDQRSELSDQPLKAGIPPSSLPGWAIA
jgi:hypothetical protein